jgi:hypothetical protein
MTSSTVEGPSSPNVYVNKLIGPPRLIYHACFGTNCVPVSVPRPGHRRRWPSCRHPDRSVRQRPASELDRSRDFNRPQQTRMLWGPNCRSDSRTEPVAMTSSSPASCARRGVRVRGPTRPAGGGFHLSGQRMSPGTGRRSGIGCTLREKRNALEFRPNRMDILLPSTCGTEPVVRVAVRRGVPVTVRRADVRRLIVERSTSEEARVVNSFPRSA